MAGMASDGAAASGLVAAAAGTAQPAAPGVAHCDVPAATSSFEQKGGFGEAAGCYELRGRTGRHIVPVVRAGPWRGAEAHELENDGFVVEEKYRQKHPLMGVYGFASVANTLKPAAAKPITTVPLIMWLTSEEQMQVEEKSFTQTVKVRVPDDDDEKEFDFEGAHCPKAGMEEKFADTETGMLEFEYGCDALAYRLDRGEALRLVSVKVWNLGPFRCWGRSGARGRPGLTPSRDFISVGVAQGRGTAQGSHRAGMSGARGCSGARDRPELTLSWDLKAAAWVLLSLFLGSLIRSLAVQFRPVALVACAKHCSTVGYLAQLRTPKELIAMRPAWRSLPGALTYKNSH